MSPISNGIFYGDQKVIFSKKLKKNHEHAIFDNFARNSLFEVFCMIDVIIKFSSSHYVNYSAVGRRFDHGLKIDYFYSTLLSKDIRAVLDEPSRNHYNQPCKC